MGTINYTIPQAGTDLNSVADPEIATALTTLRTLVNGNIDTNNLSPTAAITFAQLAAGAGRMSLVTKTAAYAANSGELVVAGVTGAPFTVTLPAASLNALVCVVAGASATGANPITVARQGAAIINGTGLSSAASLVLGTPGASVVLQSDGTNWFTIGGQQDTGWIALTLTTNVQAATGFYIPAVRIRSDKAELRGGMQNNTGGTVAIGTTIASSVALKPPSTVQFTASYDGVTTGPATMSVAGGGTALVAAITFNNTDKIILDGIVYSVV